MKKCYLSALVVLFAMQQATAQLQKRNLFVALVVDETRSLPLEGATVKNNTSNEVALTNETGQFFFKNKPADADSLVVSAIGHEQKTIAVKDLIANKGVLPLRQKAVALQELVIVGGRTNPTQLISQVDIKLRAINNSQEVLRMVPGLFIGQHAGGGKAEQIFLRGFDIDHGTDISIGVDGMPVNMVSHAHGQGYADLHFLIPELIDNVAFKKGTYAADKGNFATSGFVDFRTTNALANSSVKLEAGMFNTFRTVGMFNLLNKAAKEKGQTAYIASEYMYTKGYFNNPQDFNRINLFGKYNGTLSKTHHLNASASYFSSKWDASGQIPDRAVETGIIGFYGAIDPNEGGQTSRANANLILTSTLRNGSYFRNQAYYSKYQFDLFSNFTFFKEDPVNGDQIRQRESRDLYGYNGSYHKTSYLGNVKLNSEFGVSARLDRTVNSELSRTKDRTVTITPIMLGDIAENNFAAYVSETISFSPRFSMNAGLRYDLFQNKYTDKLNGNLEEKASASILSPKLNFFYHLSPNLQLYLNTGRGFHSNDTRVVVPQNGLQILPAAYGSDIGAVLKPSKNLLVNAALWYLWLDQEFVYVGDEGVVEPSGKSKRYGADLSVRYQPLPWLYADLDFNYSYARAVGEPKGEDYLPLAPKFTSIGGLTTKLPSGINASLRYRYMGDRPANEDNSVVAKGYFITDAFISYQVKKYEFAITAQNVLDVQWKETQFDTESRLFNETQPVSEIHFTPGTPFFLKASFTYLF